MLRDRFVRSLRDLPNFDSQRIQLSSPIAGLTANHRVDVAVVGRGMAAAFAHALPFGASAERELYLHRSAVLEAAGDLPEQAVRVALYRNPPAERRELLEETERLLNEASVEFARADDSAQVAALFAEPLITLGPDQAD